MWPLGHFALKGPRALALMVGSIFAVLFLTVVYQAQAEEAQVAQGKIVVLETSQGTIELKLFCDGTPKTCENFIGLVNKGYYDGVIFHRVIKGFMVQGGDPTGTGAGGESIFGKPFEDEISPEVTFDKEGILAMANSGPGTNGSQFFITVAATPWLNGHHTIFGEVSAGYDVVQKIENTPTGAEDRPLKEVKILRATVKK